MNYLWAVVFISFQFIYWACTNLLNTMPSFDSFHQVLGDIKLPAPFFINFICVGNKADSSWLKNLLFKISCILCFPVAWLTRLCVFNPLLPNWLAWAKLLYPHCCFWHSDVQVQVVFRGTDAISKKTLKEIYSQIVDHGNPSRLILVVQSKMTSCARKDLEICQYKVEIINVS